MGTSTNYKAPSSQQWSNLKRQVTRLARQGKPSPKEIKGVLGAFAAVNSGSSQVARGGGSGRKGAAQNVAQKIGGFVSAIADVGFREAFEQAGLGALEGTSVRDITASLLDYLGGPSGTLDEVDARNALASLMDEIFEDAESPEDVEEVMETISEGESYDELIRRFLGYCFYEQFCRNFYEHLVARVGDSQASECCDEIRDYICTAVKDETRYLNASRIDWNGSEGQQLADKILRDTLEVFIE